MKKLPVEECFFCKKDIIPEEGRYAFHGYAFHSDCWKKMFDDTLWGKPCLE